MNAASSSGVVSSNGDLIDRAQQLYQSGNYPQAIELLKQSIDTNRAEPLKQAMGWSNLALVYQQLGDWQAANNAIAQSLKLLQNRTIPSRSGIFAQTLEIQGQLQFAQGKTEAALTTWEQTAQLYTQIGDDGGITRSQINQCHALRVLGFYRRAQTILEKLQASLGMRI